MTRGWSGAILLSSGRLRVGPVTLRDERITDLRELLQDLSLPGLCLVLGAGASYGVVPMSRKEIAALARELLRRLGEAPWRHRLVQLRRHRGSTAAFSRDRAARTATGRAYDSKVRDTVRRMAWELHLPIATDWHLPLPEDEAVRLRADYQNAVLAWRLARCIVLIGYGFGGGDDALSFEDFGRNAETDARVHVLCPNPDNRDLRRQVAYALRGRGPRFRVFGQAFRWLAFAEATLALLKVGHADHVRHAAGRESELCALHDAR